MDTSTSALLVAPGLLCLAMAAPALAQCSSDPFDLSTSFQQYLPQASWALRTWNPLIGDLNGDGHDDIAWNSTSNGENLTWVALWTGTDFTIQGAPIRHTNTALAWSDDYSVDLTDVTGDGLPDLVWNALDVPSGSGTNRIYVGASLGNGSFNFLPAFQHSSSNWGLREWQMLLADTNGDGRKDIVWNSTTENNNVSWVALASAASSSGFLECASPSVHPSGNWDFRPWLAIVGDYNGDGREELAWSSTETFQNFIFFSAATSSGHTLQYDPTPELHPLTNWQGRDWMARAFDVDQDGDSDLVWSSTNPADAKLRVGLVTGTGAAFSASFLPEQNHSYAGWSSQSSWSLDVGDITGNGLLDLVWNATSSVGNQIIVGLSRGDGRFGLGQPRQTHPSSDWGVREWSTLTGDFDSDGRMDLLWNSTNLPQNYSWWGFAIGSDCNINGTLDECDVASGLSDDCDGDGILDECAIAANPALDIDGNGTLDVCEFAGTPFCGPAVNNSTQRPGLLIALGSNRLSLNNLDLWASQLPDTSNGYFLVSRGATVVNTVANSVGRLCISGAPIGRYSLFVFQTTNTGVVSFGIDATMLSQPSGPVAAQVGETWNFQAWHRDTFMGQSTSNFTNAVRVTFEL